MPVIPQVDIYGAGSFGEKHQQVDTKTYRNHKCTDSSIICHGCSRRPAHIKHFKLEVIDFHYFVKRRSKCRSQQRRHDRKPHETDTDLQSGFQRIPEPYAYAEPEHSKNHRHHYSGAETDYVFKNFFHLLYYFLEITFIRSGLSRHILLRSILSRHASIDGTPPLLQPAPQ